MKKQYKIEVDCANCATKIEDAINKHQAVKSVNINYIMGKLNIDFKDDADIQAVMKEIKKLSRKIEPDCEIYV